MSIDSPNDTTGDMTAGRDLFDKDAPDRMQNALGSRGRPIPGPCDHSENRLADSDDSTRDPVDRSAEAVTCGPGENAAATSHTSSPTIATATGEGRAAAVFDSEEEAQRAVEQLRSAGVSDYSLSLIAKSAGTTTTTSGDGAVVDEDDGRILRGILGGGALGAGLGIAALAIPGVGPLVAAGAIASSAVPGAAALGAAVGAAAGTLNEVLNSHGVSKDDAAYYGDRIQRGGTFVSVDTSQSGVDTVRAQEILYSCGGHSASSPKAF